MLSKQFKEKPDKLAGSDTVHFVFRIYASKRPARTNTSYWSHCKTYVMFAQKSYQVFYQTNGSSLGIGRLYLSIIDQDRYISIMFSRDFVGKKYIVFFV